MAGSLRAAEYALGRAVTAADATERVAGEAANDKLATCYAKVARTESKSANLWRRSTLGLFLNRPGESGDS